MRNLSLIALTLLSSLCLSCLAFAEDAPSTCTKDSKELTASGKNEAEKKADCEKKGGTWSAVKPAEKNKKSPSGGGGW